MSGPETRPGGAGPAGSAAPAGPAALPGSTSPAAGGDHTISLLRANLAGVPLFLALMIAVILPYAALHGKGETMLGAMTFGKLVVLIPSIIAGTVAHEGIHGLGWALAGRLPLSTVRYGFHWKTVTPYAHLTVPIASRAYRVGVVLPGILVGLVPAAAGYAFSSAPLVWFGGLFTGAAAGDLLGLWAIRRIPAETFVRDHPSRVGCTVVDPASTPETSPPASPYVSPSGTAGSGPPSHPSQEG